MARYLGPKVKLSRRVGVPIADIPKHTAKRQLTPPGPHGFRGRRLKDYGVRLVENKSFVITTTFLKNNFAVTLHKQVAFVATPVKYFYNY